jgi:heme A synthase
MNNLNELEKHLRGWTPRRPAARLEARIFGRTASPDFAAAAALRWLAPAMACLLFSLVALQGNFATARAGHSRAGVLPQSNTLFCSSAGENLWERVTFEWTTGGQMTSTMRSLTPLWTNSLMH